MNLIRRYGHALRALPLLLHHPAGLHIASHLTLVERSILYRLASSAPQHPVLEIGSYLGASAYFLAAGIAAAGASSSVICVDTWRNDAMAEGQRDTYEEFIANTHRYSTLIRPIRGLSYEVVEQVRLHAPDGLGMLFVDGDHSWEGVKRDWTCYRPLLRRGSIVAFHDIGWASGVERVVREDVMPLVSGADQLTNLWWGILQ